MRILVLVLLGGCAMEVDVPKKQQYADCCRIVDTPEDAGCDWRAVPYQAPLYAEPWIDEARVCRNAGYKPWGEL